LGQQREAKQAVLRALEAAPRYESSGAVVEDCWAVKSLPIPIGDWFGHWGLWSLSVARGQLSGD
jgi:hypothetical protein